MRIKKCLCMKCKQIIEDTEWYAERKCCSEIVNPKYMNKYYKLKVDLKCICPHCGAVTDCVYERTVCVEEIVNEMLLDN